MLTLHYRTPLSGRHRGGNGWTIEKVECPPLAIDGIAPDATLVKACHDAMRDGQGKKVPVDTLRTYDLREGLAAAFRTIETKPDGDSPSARKEAAQ